MLPESNKNVKIVEFSISTLQTLEWHDKQKVNVVCLGHSFTVARVLDEIKIDSNLMLCLVLQATKTTKNTSTQ
jgi:hypothetical protein